MKTTRTDLLEIAFEEGGPDNGRPVLLLHGWPDAPCGWNAIAPQLHAGGWRTIAPYLRGSGPTRFLSDQPPRVGAGLAIAQDAVDLADRLALDRFAAVWLHAEIHRLADVGHWVVEDAPDEAASLLEEFLRRTEAR